MNHDSDATKNPGQTSRQYREVSDWAQIPADIDFVEAIGVTIGTDDRLFVFNRGNPSVLMFHPDGTFIGTWGENSFVRPHGICGVPDGTLYLTDDLGHRVTQFSDDGTFLRNIGPAGIASSTGVDGFDYRSIACAGPYNLPTNVAVTKDNHLFITDGYGNARVHHFDAEGDLVQSWGESGSGTGQFNVPHGICVDQQDRVLVADRENSRIQIFDRQGTFLTSWTDVVRPCQIFAAENGEFFVAELGNRNGRFPWHSLPERPTDGRVSIFDDQGNLLSRWGRGLDARQSDGFYACHDICVDSEGSVYVGEVAVTAATAAGEDASGLPTLRKFVRV